MTAIGTFPIDNMLPEHLTAELFSPGILPIEVFDKIAADSESSYRAMLAIPQFARSLTPGKIVDFMIGFGHTIVITNQYVQCLRHGIFHRLDGPAQYGSYLWGFCIRGDYLSAMIVPFQEWWKNGQRHRDTLPDGSIGPAVLRFGDDDKEYWQNGQRINDPFCDLCSDRKLNR